MRPAVAPSAVPAPWIASLRRALGHDGRARQMSGEVQGDIGAAAYEQAETVANVFDVDRLRQVANIARSAQADIDRILDKESRS